MIRSTPLLAIFIDGCFFHGCPAHYVPPRSRVAFWSNKLAENVARDARQTLALESAGWRVLRFWEHEVFETLSDVVDRVALALAGHRRIEAPEWRVTRVQWLDATRFLESRCMRDLRNPALQMTEERRRTTTKAREPVSTARALSPARASVRRR